MYAGFVGVMLSESDKLRGMWVILCCTHNVGRVTAVRFLFSEGEQMARYGLPYKGSKNTMTFPKRTMIQHLSGCNFFLPV